MASTLPPGVEREWTSVVAAADFDRARELLKDVHAATGDAAPWRLELDACYWLAGRPGYPLPGMDEVEGLVGRSGDADTALSGMASIAVRAGVLAFDLEAVRAWTPVLERLGESSNVARVRAEVAASWQLLMTGDAHSVRTRLDPLRQSTRRAALPSALIETETLAALSGLAIGDIAEATEAARRASRMAQSEASPPDEFLASLTLARVRRSAGSSHLAARILSALSHLVSPAFLPWIEWESILAGAITDAPLTGQGSSALREMIRAALGGSRGRFETASREAVASAAGFRPLAVEVTDLVAATDPESSVTASAPMQQWIEGQSHLLPHGLHGIAIARSSSDDEGATIGYALSRPEVPGRRVLAIGVPLAAATTEAPAAILEPSRRPQERTDAALAFLTMHGTVIDERDFFRELYGFEYEPVLHTSILSSLIHRMRTTVESTSALDRDEGRLHLRPKGRLIAWDPRCHLPLEDRLLRQLAVGGAGTAREAASRLGVPLRTVQAVLAELVESGACRRQRKGRTIEYEVEDTTFSEPTITRARVWRGE